jgi:hypothetical protein
MPGISCVDQIVGATGSRPDHSLTRELRTQHDPWIESTLQLAPLIDPNEHSCGTVRPHGHRELSHPESGFFAIGAKGLPALAMSSICDNLTLTMANSAATKKPFKNTKNNVISISRIMV